jgi:hypothetical protein
MVRAVICLAWLVLSCGPILFWWRRDNLFGYLQAGFFFASIVVPVIGTSIVADLDQGDVNRYADIMVIGAIVYMAGLCYGAFLGQRVRLPRLVIRAPLRVVPRFVVKRTRHVAVAGVGILALSFVLLRYVPLLTANRIYAKYGIGLYAPGFARGGLVLHVGLIVASTVLPVVLVLILRNRRMVDVVLAGALFVGVVVTLSRGRAFIGPLVFLVALAIERRWRPWRITAAVCFAFVAGTLFNELVHLSSSEPGSTLASRVAASAPDVIDHVEFLSGFEAAGGEEVGLKPIIASFRPDKGEYNASTYALRIRTGLPDVTGLASGGLRLPAPIWGYASFGFPGLVLWSFLSGVAIGCGARMMRRLLSAPYERGSQAMNLVLAWVFFEGTFVVLGEFYFIERVGLISLALAFILCWSRSRSFAADGDQVGPGPVTTITAGGGRSTSSPAALGRIAAPAPPKRGRPHGRRPRGRTSRH